MIGLVFARVKNGVTEYWKITGNPYNKGDSYPVIKCSKKGKEFRETNGFSVSFVSSLKENKEGCSDGWIIGSFSSEKAKIDEGIMSATRLRRIQYLQDKISAYQKELNDLMKEF